MSSSRSAVSTSAPGPSATTRRVKQQHLVVLDRLPDVVRGRHEGRSTRQLPGKRLQVASPGRRRRVPTSVRRARSGRPAGRAPGPGRRAAADPPRGNATAASRTPRLPWFASPKSTRSWSSRVKGRTGRALGKRAMRTTSIARSGSTKPETWDWLWYATRTGDDPGNRPSTSSRPDTGGQQAHQRAQERRLARPVGADERERRLPTDDEVDPCDDRPAVVSDGQADGPDRRRRPRRRGARRRPLTAPDPHP